MRATPPARPTDDRRDGSSETIVFLDTECTDLVVAPRLLSVGIVCGGRFHDEFYAEVTDTDRLQGSSDFAAKVVLPQFGHQDDAACRYDQIGARLWAFFDRQINALAPSDTLQVAFGCDLDWTLTRLAIKEAGRSCWRRLEGRLRPSNVIDIRGFQAGEAAADRYFEAQQRKPLARHHALCDARALRIYYEAATACGMLNRPQPVHPPADPGRVASGGHRGEHEQRGRGFPFRPHPSRS